MINYDIPISNCKLGVNFFYSNYDEVKMYNIEDYYCPDWTNLTIQGNWYSPEFKVITLNYVRCTGDNCSSDEEFE